MTYPSIPHPPRTQPQRLGAVARIAVAMLAAVLMIVGALSSTALGNEPEPPEPPESTVGQTVDPALLTVPSTRAGTMAGTTAAVETQSDGNTYQLGDSLNIGVGSVFGCASPWSPIANHNPLGSNAGEFEVDLPFAFEFYGIDYTQITVGVNGGILMGFGAGDVADANTTLASNTLPGIFPYWDDLQFDTVNLFNSMYTCTTGVEPNRTFKVIWFNVDCVGCDAAANETISFEVAFHEPTDGLTFTYNDTNFAAGNNRNHANQATIGIDSGTGPHLQYSHNQDSIVQNPFTIQFWTPTCQGEQATVVATRAGDKLHGTDGNDVIVGSFGDDTIRGYDGDDLICAGIGDDIVRAGAGDDNVEAGPGDDNVNGGAGDDTVDASQGNDTVRGGAGNDDIDAGGGADTVIGGGGDDRIDGGAGDDDLRGNGGTDIMSGDSGNDTMRGGSASDSMSGGDGNDEMHGNGGGDSIGGGSGDDVVNGNNGADDVTGHAGNDVVSGGNGPDSVDGDDGDDDVRGGGNNDQISGGDGTDTCNGNGGANDFHIGGCEVALNIEIL